MIHDRLKLRLAGAQRGVGLVAFVDGAGVRPARCRDPQSGDGEHERHSGSFGGHDDDLGSPGGKGIALRDRNGHQKRGTHERAPGGEVGFTAGLDRRAQEAALGPVPPCAQDDIVGQGLTRRAPGQRLAEEQIAVGVKQLDDAVRPHVDRFIEAAQPLGLKGGRQQSDEPSLPVA